MILSLSVLAIALLMIGIGMLRYRKRSVAKNITTILVIVISAVASCIVARIAAVSIGNIAVDLIANKYPDVYAQLAADLPVTASVVPLLAAMIVAPILFIFAMLILRLLSA